jgi:hypothetical protein
MYYYVYKITNTVNGKYYYGVHKSNTPVDNNYLGSGVLINRAIKKHGKESFVKEVVEYFDTLDAAFEYEKNLITPDLIESNECYNVNIGGKGGSTEGHIKDLTYHKSPKSQEHRDKISKTLTGKSYLTEEGRRRKSELLKNNSYKKGVKESEQTKANKRAAFAKSEKHGANFKNKSPELCKKISEGKKGKKTGADNIMADPEKRAKVGQSKIGLKRLNSPDGNAFKMARKNTEKWNQLIEMGYTPLDRVDL